MVKKETSLDRIEKLIVDGNKEVIGYIDKKIEETKQELKQELGGKIDNLDRKFDHLDKKVDRIDKTLNATALASYDLLIDVRKDVKQVDAKLDKHLFTPISTSGLVPHAA